ncbi:MAG: NAD-dependent dihydropyrimidine dehydrogenase subunit PreA, partial [Bacteroidales bacterium]|nr:NAD-dependent dihydropyrimidine dehydrogenase subunit PreA [Bacteroidales bacterium]
MNQLHLKQEAVRCLLCENAPCTAAVRQGDPARAVRAVRFDNQVLGARLFAACSEADLEAAEKACIHYDRPVRLREIAKSLPAPTPETELPSLEIDFCGLHCENPFFLASSAVCTNYEMVASALEAGWAGVFYKT